MMQYWEYLGTRSSPALQIYLITDSATEYQNLKMNLDQSLPSLVHYESLRDYRREHPANTLSLRISEDRIIK
jgi:hypothetical protein